VWGVDVDAVLHHQAGVITRRQALAAGLDRRTVDHLLRVRRWRPLHPQVYLARDRPHDAEVDVRAAVLWGGPGAVLDGVAAAWWWGLADTVPPVVGITLSCPRAARGRPGVAVRCRRLPSADVTHRRGVAVTGAARTVLDAAADLGADGPAFLDRALRDRVPFAAVLAAHRRAGGSPGADAAARLLAGSADRAAAASAERLAHLLRDSGAQGWVGGAGAVLFPQARVAVEPEGWAHHPGRPALACRPGWTVLRCPWPDLVDHPRLVLARIGAALAASRPP
jgi:hypothetical protein